MPLDDFDNVDVTVSFIGKHSTGLIEAMPSNATMVAFHELGLRSYVSEPDRGRRKLENVIEWQASVFLRGHPNILKRLLIQVCTTIGSYGVIPDPTDEKAVWISATRFPGQVARLHLGDSPPDRRASSAAGWMDA